MTVCMHVPASVAASINFSVCLLKLLSPLNLGDVTKTPGTCLAGSQSHLGFSVSRAESKPPEVHLRKAVPLSR